MCNDYLICSNKYSKCTQVICAIQVPAHSGSHAYLYNTCILPIFLYGSECRAVTKVDACRIDALDQCLQWCLRTLHGIKWHQFVCNEQVRSITKQPNLTVIIQSRRLSIFGHIACKDDDADAKMILTAPPPENWKRPPGRPSITWLNTVQ